MFAMLYLMLNMKLEYVEVFLQLMVSPSCSSFQLQLTLREIKIISPKVSVGPYKEVSFS